MRYFVAQSFLNSLILFGIGRKYNRMIIENKLINSLIKITYHKINTFIAHSTYSQSFLSFFTNLYTSKFFIKSHEHNRGPIITPRPTAAPKQPLKKKKKTCAPPRQPPYCYNRQTTLHYLPIPPTVCNHPKESANASPENMVEKAIQQARRHAGRKGDTNIRGERSSKLE